MSKKIGKDVIGKGKRAGVIRTKKEQEDYEKYRQKLAQDQQEKEEKEKKKVGSERMIDEREPTAEQLASQEAQIREDIARFKALKRGETVHVKEHHRRRPASAKEETEGEEEEEENEEE